MSISINEKLIIRRYIVVSVGLYLGNARSAIGSVGLNDGDVVVLVNSEPREVLRGGRRQPTEAMEVIRRFVNESFSDLRVVKNQQIHKKLPKGSRGLPPAW